MARRKKTGDLNDMWCEKKDFREPIHPPFTGERRQEVERQHAILKDVYIGDYDNYELGFRGDMNPDREISVWKQIADGFNHLVADEPRLSKRRAIFCACFLTRLGDRECMKTNYKSMPSLLPKVQKDKIVEYMYSTYGDPLPMRFVVLMNQAEEQADEVPDVVN